MAVAADRCELFANKTWLTVSVEDVLEKWTDRRLRCIECHGAVKAHKAGPDDIPPAHFEHRDAHVGCSLCHVYKVGSPTSPHPKALR